MKARREQSRAYLVRRGQANVSTKRQNPHSNNNNSGQSLISPRPAFSEFDVRMWVLKVLTFGAFTVLFVCLFFPNVFTTTTGEITPKRDIQIRKEAAASELKQTNLSQQTDVEGLGYSHSASSAEHDQKIHEMKLFKATHQRRLSPTKVFYEGRRIAPMELLAQKKGLAGHSVKVYLFDDFLSAEECDALRSVHDKHVMHYNASDPIMCFESLETLKFHLEHANQTAVARITGDVFTPGTRCLNASFSSQVADWLNHNWSYSTAFYPGESKFSYKLAEIIEQTSGLNPANGGKFQITSYPEHVGYKAHTDCTEENPDKRDRMGTILIYLDTVADGGETEFPELGIWVKPKKGRALLWNNMNETGFCEPLSIHQANKVNNGHKYILQRWYYYESFYSLGKRPSPPSLPPRSPLQAMVSCDEYKHGSCRWYDEWNYDNIDEYRRQKSGLS